jgi:hypothetical protein
MASVTNVNVIRALGKSINNIFDCLNGDGILHYDYSFCLFSVEVLNLFKNEVNDENEQGKTPLRIITELYHGSGSWDRPQKSIVIAARALLAFGADPFYGEKGLSAYNYACEKNMKTLLEIFDMYDCMDVKEAECDY